MSAFVTATLEYPNASQMSVMSLPSLAPMLAAFNCISNNLGHPRERLGSQRIAFIAITTVVVFREDTYDFDSSLNGFLWLIRCCHNGFLITEMSRGRFLGRTPLPLKLIFVHETFASGWVFFDIKSQRITLHAQGMDAFCMKFRAGSL